jgi:hypothetical protein
LEFFERILEIVQQLLMLLLPSRDLLFENVGSQTNGFGRYFVDKMSDVDGDVS